MSHAPEVIVCTRRHIHESVLLKFLRTKPLSSSNTRYGRGIPAPAETWHSPVSANAEEDTEGRRDCQVQWEILNAEGIGETCLLIIRVVGQLGQPVGGHQNA